MTHTGHTFYPWKVGKILLHLTPKVKVHDNIHKLTPPKKHKKWYLLEYIIYFILNPGPWNLRDNVQRSKIEEPKKTWYCWWKKSCTNWYQDQAEIIINLDTVDLCHWRKEPCYCWYTVDKLPHYLPGYFHPFGASQLPNRPNPNTLDRKKPRHSSVASLVILRDETTPFFSWQMGHVGLWPFLVDVKRVCVCVNKYIYIYIRICIHTRVYKLKTKPKRLFKHGNWILKHFWKKMFGHHWEDDQNRATS